MSPNWLSWVFITSLTVGGYPSLSYNFLIKRRLDVTYLQLIWRYYIVKLLAGCLTLPNVFICLVYGKLFYFLYLLCNRQKIICVRRSSSYIRICFCSTIIKSNFSELSWYTFFTWSWVVPREQTDEQTWRIQSSRFVISFINAPKSVSEA